MNTYEGNQFILFASGANSTTFSNDDWMISPEFTIDNVTSSIIILGKISNGPVWT